MKKTLPVVLMEADGSSAIVGEAEVMIKEKKDGALTGCSAGPIVFQRDKKASNAQA